VPVVFSTPSSRPALTSDLQQDIKLLAAASSEYVTRNDDPGWINDMVGHTDPGSLVATADQHGVLPLFARALSLAGIHCEIAQARAREIAFRNLALTAELVHLMGALRGLGIRALTYKGPVLGQQLYGDATLRQFRDLDILVAPNEVLRTRDVLCQLGYKEAKQFSRPLLTKFINSQCEWQMMGTTSRTIVELHWALFPRYASLDLSFAELNHASVAIPIAGETVRTIGFSHLALALSAHGTKHFWHRLGWLVDFAVVLRSYTAADAEKLLDDAARKGMKRILLISAALVDKVLQLRLPKSFETAISDDCCARLLADNMQQSLWAGTIPEDLLSQNIVMLRSRECWSDQATIVSRLAFTPGPEEWQVALPEWAAWLYRPIRIARAARYFPRIIQWAFSFRKQ
jgi:hypothetical protein